MSSEDFRMSLAQERRDEDADDLAAQEQAAYEDVWDRAHEARVEQRIAEAELEHVAWAHERLAEAMGGGAA